MRIFTFKTAENITLPERSSWGAWSFWRGWPYRWLYPRPKSIRSTRSCTREPWKKVCYVPIQFVLRFKIWSTCHDGRKIKTSIYWDQFYDRQISEKNSNFYLCREETILVKNCFSNPYVISLKTVRDFIRRFRLFSDNYLLFLPYQRCV